MEAAPLCVETGEWHGQTSEASQRGRMKKMGAVGLAGAVLLLAPLAIHHFGSHANADDADFREAEQKEEIVVTRPRFECSKSGANCFFSRCCQISGHKCFEKKPGHASCSDKCIPGRDGTCNLVSDSTKLMPVVYEPGTSMYCWTVYVENTGSTKKSYELDLLRTQLKFGAGLFGCSAWDIFSDVKAQLTPGPPAELFAHKIEDPVGDFHLMKRTHTGTWVNTPIYYQAWLKIREIGRWKYNDYIVKVDADTVFLPQRLVDYLKTKRVTEHGVYYENCKNVDSGFFGNLEVISNKAVEIYLNNIEECKQTLCWKNGVGGCADDWKYGPWGEDLFAQRCMDKHGVEKVEAFDLTTDGACPADRPKDQRKNKKWKPNCATTVTPAMHPFKTPTEWFSCVSTIMHKTYYS